MCILPCHRGRHFPDFTKLYVVVISGEHSVHAVSICRKNTINHVLTLVYHYGGEPELNAKSSSKWSTFYVQNLAITLK